MNCCSASLSLLPQLTISRGNDATAEMDEGAGGKRTAKLRDAHVSQSLQAREPCHLIVNNRWRHERLPYIAAGTCLNDGGSGVPRERTPLTSVANASAFPWTSATTVRPRV